MVFLTDKDVLTEKKQYQKLDDTYEFDKII